LSLLLAALNGPQWGFRWVTQPTRGADLFVAVDVSDSMRVTDLAPNRLERARRKLRDLLQLLKGERLGLVAFAGESVVLCPLTLDYEAFVLFLDYLDTDLIPVQGTDLGGAVAAAVQGFEENSPRRRHILLITDGEDHEAGIERAIALAKERGVKVSVVGIGAPEGAPIPEADGSGFRKDANGQVILSRLNEPLLKRLAAETGGRYARSVAGDLDLQHVFLEGIARERLQAENGEEKRKQQFTERFQLFLAPALLLLLLPAFLERRPRRTPAAPLASFFPPGWLLATLAALLAAPAATAGPLKQGNRAYEE
jgi:Ca-activated chloride channel family protein